MDARSSWTRSTWAILGTGFALWLLAVLGSEPSDTPPILDGSLVSFPAIVVGLAFAARWHYRKTRVARTTPEPARETMATVLLDARRRGLCDEATYRKLLAVVLAPAPPRPHAATVPVPAAARVALGAAVQARVAPPAERPVPVPQGVARPATRTQTSGPRASKTRVASAWDLFASEVAVHGLAYLGVLLTFVGTLGFVLFAFAGVRVALRPLAEVAVPAVLFGSARFLRGRGAPFVSRSLEFLAGALTPVVALASVADGAPVPPDLHEAPLVLALAATAGTLAVIYAAIGRRDSGSPLLWLVAPLVWVSAGCVGLAFQRGASAPQMALVGLAVTATTALGAANRDRRALRLAGPGAVGAYALTVVFALTEGLPAAPLAVAALATIGTVEIVVPARALVLQALVVGVTSALLVPALGWGVAGVVAGLAAVALLERHELGVPAREGTIAAAAVGGAGLLAATADKRAALVAWGLLALWAHARILSGRPLRAGADVSAASAVLLPFGAGAAVIAVSGPGPGWLACAAALLAATAVARLREVSAPVYSWWLCVSGVCVAFGAGLSVGAAPAGELAVAAAGAGAALSVAPVRPAVRVWTAATAFAIGLSLLEPAGYVWGVAGALCVASAVAWRVRGVGHLALVGLIAAAGALASPAGPQRTSALAAWTLAWLTLVVAGELGTSPVHGVVPGRLRAAVTAAQTVVSALSLPLLVVSAGRLWGIFAGQRARSALAVAACALVAGGVAALVQRRRPLAPSLAGSAFALSAVAVALAAPSADPTIVTLATSITVVWLVGGSLRTSAMRWTAWAASAALTLIVASRLGVRAAGLPAVALAWSSVLACGALALDDVRHGRRAAGCALRTRALDPALAFGTLGLPGALGFALAVPGAFGRLALATAVVYAVLAWQLRAGAVSAPAYALAVAGGVAMVPSRALENPWQLVLVAAVLTVVAFAVLRVETRRDVWLRSDGAPFVVAHGVVAVALARAVVVGSTDVTWTLAGALALAVAIAGRRVEYAIGGAALVVTGAAAAGHGWLALALAGCALGCAVAARRERDARWRNGFLAAGCACAAVSWIEFATWMAWTRGEGWTATVLVGAGLVSLLAAGCRARLASRAETLAWGALGSSAVLTGAAAVALESTAFAPHARGTLLAVAVGFASLAAAAGVCAAPLRISWMRFAAPVLAVASAQTVEYAYGGGATVRVAVALAAALAGTLAVVVLRDEERPWLRPLAVLAVFSSTDAVVTALSVWPRRDLAVAAVALTGAQCLAAGVVLRRRPLVVAAPAAFCASWLVYASQALTGDAQWFVVPIGATVCAMIEIERRGRIAGGTHLSDDLIAVEWFGMGFATVPALLQTMSALPYGLLAVVLGVVLCGYGTLTRVRRRAVAGGGVAAIGAALLILVPLVQLVPRVHGVALWAAVATLGLGLIAAATSLEQGRTRVRATVRRLNDVMEGWE